MRHSRWSIPVVVATVLLLAVAPPVAATTAADASPQGWFNGLLPRLLQWGLFEAVTGSQSETPASGDPQPADSAGALDTEADSTPEQGSDTEAAPYVDPNG